MPESTRVFISYSHESDAIAAHVIELSARLRQDGVDAWIDRYTAAPPEGWPRWTQSQIEAADFVICVCTETYRKAFEGRNDPERGLGVNAEGFIILQDLYDRGNRSDKYIPVTYTLPGRDRRKAIPVVLRAFHQYDLPEHYEELYRRVTRQPAVLPPGLAQAQGVDRPALLQEERPPQPINSNGFDNQTEIAEYLRPDTQSMDRLAPSEGLFISRLINPPSHGSDDIVTTVWIAARGGLQYMLDSVRIFDHAPYGMGPVAGVALPPDAEYRFTYHDNCDYETALNPALSVGPETRRIAWFTVAVAPDEPLYYLGRLWIRFGYQTSDGRRGTLVLAPPFSSARELAALTGREIMATRRDGGESFSQIVTPGGVQRGLEEGYEPAFRFSAIKIPSWFNVKREAFKTARDMCRKELAERKALSDELGRKKTVPALSKLLDQGESWAADVLAGVGDDASTAALADRLDRNPSDRNLIHGLAVRHMVKADDLLARHVLSHRDSFANKDILETAAFALTMNPGGNRVAVFDLLRRTSLVTGITSILAALPSDMPAKERRRLVALAGGPLGEEIFVRGSMHAWADPPPPEAMLEFDGEDRYRVTLRLSADVHRFKVADARWTSSCNWGAANPGNRIALAEPFPLRCHNLSHDIELDLSGAPPGDYRFEIDTGDPTQPTVTVTKTASFWDIGID